MPTILQQQEGVAPMDTSGSVVEACGNWHKRLMFRDCWHQINNFLQSLILLLRSDSEHCMTSSDYVQNYINIIDLH